MSFKRDKISYAVGQRIKMFRTERKISQEELALLSDIYPAYLGRLERGERCPTVETIYKVCDGLKISMSDLLDFDVDAKPTSEVAKRRIEGNERLVRRGSFAHCRYCGKYCYV